VTSGLNSVDQVTTFMISLKSKRIVYLLVNALLSVLTSQVYQHTLQLPCSWLIN